MKRIIWAVAIISLLFSAFPAAAEFYVIGAGGKAGTQINSVPYTISSPGLYCLAKNLAYSPTSGYAITINADNVTLDLMGFTLSGPGKASGLNRGIYIDGAANVEIRNGCITSFGNMGIWATNGAKWIRILGLRVTSNGNMGAQLTGFYNQAVGCSFLDNGSIGAECGSGLIKGNVASGNGGIGLYGNGVISGNVCFSNAGHGILSSPGTSVLDNTCYSNGDRGIFASDGCTVKGNTCRQNTQAGIETYNNCLIINNTSHGITVGTGCTALNNCKY